MKELNITEELPIGAVGTVLDGAMTVEVIIDVNIGTLCCDCAFDTLPKLCELSLCLDIDRSDDTNIHFETIKK